MIWFKRNVKSSVSPLIAFDLWLDQYRLKSCVPLQSKNWNLHTQGDSGWRWICLWEQSPHKGDSAPPIRGSRGIQNLPWPSHVTLSEKTALCEPGIGPHRTCQSLALRLPGSRLVKGNFSLLVSHAECHSCYRCSSIRWGRAGGRWGIKHSKWETILNEVIKRTILFFLRERWRDTVEKKECVDQFSGPSVRSSHKLGTFEQQKWVLSQTQKSEVQNQNVVRLMAAQSPKPVGWCFQGSF